MSAGSGAVEFRHQAKTTSAPMSANAMKISPTWRRARFRADLTIRIDLPPTSDKADRRTRHRYPLLRIKDAGAQDLHLQLVISTDDANDFRHELSFDMRLLTESRSDAAEDRTIDRRLRRLRFFLRFDELRLEGGIIDRRQNAVDRSPAGSEQHERQQRRSTHVLPPM
jgi:hypothetical protein